MLKNLLTPNARVQTPVSLAIAGAWVVFVLAFWSLAPLDKLPEPGQVLEGFGREWQRGAAVQMFTSLMLSLESIAWATAIGLTLAYFSTIPALRPPAILTGLFRFSSLAGLVVIFLLYTNSGHALKVAVLTFVIAASLVYNMVNVIDAIPKSRFDYARTIGLNWWQVQREVVIRGTLASAFDSVRANAAIAWMMLTAVEGLSRTEGGIGVTLLNLSRMQEYSSVFAIQICILAVGLLQDTAIKALKNLVCPYAK